MKTLRSKVVLVGLLGAACSGNVVKERDCEFMPIKRITHYEQPELVVPPRQPGPQQSKGSPQWGQNILLSTVFGGGTPNLKIPREVLKCENIGEPRVMTIHTAIFNEVGPTDDYVLVGQLVYGAGGGNQTIQFDWLNGMSLSFPADSIKLNVFIEGRLGGNPTVPANVSIAALLSNGDACSKHNAQRTIGLQLAAGPFTLGNVVIPEKAREVIIYDAVGTYDATVTVSFVTGSGGTNATFGLDDLKAGSLMGDGPVIPAGSQKILISNTPAVQLTLFMVFLLDL